MGHVRPFSDADIPSVARLHETVFKTSARAEAAGREAYHAYFRDVFLRGPSQDPSLPSLVFEEDDGSITGFLGVIPRRMTMNRRQFQAAISSQFVVDPSVRAALVAVALAKAFLEGPQDLSISDEANDTSRRLWEALGGSTALLHSLHWTRPLRPARYALSVMRGRPHLRVFAAAAGPIAPLIDLFATRSPHSYLCQTNPGVSAVGDLSEQTVLAYLPRFVHPASLHVDYDEPTLRWVMNRARQRRSNDDFRAAVIRNDQRIIGWYLFHVDASGTAYVLQIVADPAAIGDVLDHLFYQAAEQGAAAVAGRLEPRFLQALSDKYCILHRRGPWVLLHARRAELLHSFESGHAVFSRLDGEWSLGF
jgi:hypothetical protein